MITQNIIQIWSILQVITPDKQWKMITHFLLIRIDKTRHVRALHKLWTYHVTIKVYAFSDNGMPGDGTS